VDASRATLDPKADALIRKMGSAYPTSLDHALEVLRTIPDGEWTPDGLIDQLKARAEQGGLKLGDLLQPIRVALTGATVSEPVNELLAVVGREESLARIAAARRLHAA
jgi:glutamyl-tRNA synthetase